MKSEKKEKEKKKNGKRRRRKNRHMVAKHKRENFTKECSSPSTHTHCHSAIVHAHKVSYVRDDSVTMGEINERFYFCAINKILIENSHYIIIISFEFERNVILLQFNRRRRLWLSVVRRSSVVHARRLVVVVRQTFKINCRL